MSGYMTANIESETLMATVQQRLQAGCEGCHAQQPEKKLQWHHTNETKTQKTDQTDLSVKRQIPWFRSTGNPAVLPVWEAELDRCAVLCSLCHRLTHDRHRQAQATAQQAALQEELQTATQLFSNSALVTEKGIKRAQRELQRLRK